MSKGGFSMRSLVVAICLLSVSMAPTVARAVIGDLPITSDPQPQSFVLVNEAGAARLWADRSDWPGVTRALGDLRDDIERVTSVVPEIRNSVTSRSERMVIVGTIGRSALIDRLAAEGRIDTSTIEGKRESFLIETVADPLTGVSEALVIAGSDKRGTIYGIYELSEEIGVSPWYWWADVHPDPKAMLFVGNGRYEQGEPSVRYRGIFINDENPDLDRWVRERYGSRPSPLEPGATIANMNSDFYAHIFEAILRMKGNYLWPAMWNNGFAEDDPDNARLADEYGIVMGTSHQEPMMRAQKEWDWHYRPEHGTWNFATHADELTEFWRGAVVERGGFENLYTIGLRGEDDTAMVHGQDENIRLLQEIVEVQRDILREELGVDPAEVPQVWSLYKEVQGYYENGLRVPDDVTLLWAEDNWGNVRRLPTLDERDRAGGAGVYYHFDYHGGPRSYRWLNTSPIAKVWDQMSLAKQYGADEVWIVNVGEFKSHELPMEFFLDLAWDTDRWSHDNLHEYMVLWAEREFGSEYAEEAAEILAGYTRFNGRRKHELLRPDTYSLINFREADTVVAEYDALVERARALHARLPEHKRSAFYQHALFPAEASANLNALYVAAGKNALYAGQGRVATNAMAELTRELFAADQALMRYFNEELEGGKWNHFMDQQHIGHRSWSPPPQDSLQAIRLTELELPADAALGVAVDGDSRAWPPLDGAANIAQATGGFGRAGGGFGPAPGGNAPAVAGAAQSGRPTLPLFDVFNEQQHGIEVFNRGQESFEYFAEAGDPWIRVVNEQGQAVPALGGIVSDQVRVPVAIDWASAPAGESTGTVLIGGAGRSIEVAVRAFNPATPDRESVTGFVESDGIVSMEAEHHTAAVSAGESRWTVIEGYGHTLSGMRAEGPVDVAGLEPGTDSPRLEYAMHRFTSGMAEVQLTVAPTLNFAPDRGLRVAVSFDDQPVEVITLVPQGYDAANGNRDWEESVRNNYRIVSSTHELVEPGEHTLKIWMIDPALVLQKIVVRDADRELPETYLGPPESFRAALQ